MSRPYRRGAAQRPEPSPSSQRAGRFPWVVMWACVAAALLTRQPALAVLAGLVALAGCVSELTARLAHEGLAVRVALSESHVVAGERVEATIEVENRKPLPLTWCEIRMPLPEGVEAADVGAGKPRDHVTLTFAPRARERVRFRVPLLARDRGAYAIGSARVRTGDWLGFTSEERDAGSPVALVAYPRPYATRMRDVPALRPLAERGAPRGLQPDPLRFAGVRDHLPGDSRKDIHWKATARVGRLQTRVFEPATSGDVVFLVNVASHPSYWIQADPDAVEVVVAASATMLHQAAGEGRRFGLVTNGIDAITRERPRAVLGRGPAKERRALELLARLSPYAAGAADALFLHAQARLAWGATLVCVTPYLDARLASALVRLRRAHHRVLVVASRPAAPAERARCAAHRIDLQTLGADERVAV